MANIKIAQLTNQINIADTDLMLIESATSTNKMTVGNFKDLINKADRGSGHYTIIVALSSGWMGTVVYRKSDVGIVTVEFNIKHPAPVELSTIAILPVGYRSSYETSFNLVAPTTGEVEAFYINSAGEIRSRKNCVIAPDTLYQGVFSFGI